MSAAKPSDSQIASFSSPDEIRSMLSSCRIGKQPVVTLDSDLLQTYDWRNVDRAMKIDLSSISSAVVDENRKLAIVGPGARYSTIYSESKKHGLAPEFEPVLGINFTMSDWAHEPLRMLSTTTSGLDGVLRNVKVVAPTNTYQTGFDTTPANGGGYDLTKLYMSSGATLGVPYEFAIPLRSMPEKTGEKIYVFANPEDAINAGIKMRKAGYAKLIQMRSVGFDELLRSREAKLNPSSENHLVVRLEGSQSFLENAEKAMDEVAESAGSKPKDAMTEISPYLIDPNSNGSSFTPIGICLCRTPLLGSVITNLTKLVSGANRTLHYYIADLDLNSSVFIPVIPGDEGAGDLLTQIGSCLADARVSLRGNRNWDSGPGDSGAVMRIEIVKKIKRFLDPEMILNPHVIGA